MIFAFTNSKGGVGKSTLSVHFAVWLQEQGTSVALVDADVQSSSSVWLHEAAPEMSILRLQTTDDILEQVPGLKELFHHVVIDGPAGLSEVTRTILRALGDRDCDGVGEDYHRQKAVMTSGPPDQAGCTEPRDCVSVGFGAPPARGR